MLEGWPAQSDFAGEKVKVHLKIDPTGHFEFVIKRKSSNPEFNRALTEYLKQLQEFGFGPHKGSRTYLFEAEFIAKE
jgi:protein TonB